MDIRLICMDLDGTALQEDHRSFTPRLLDALEAAHRQGIVIAPVTGRQYGLLPPLLKEHPIWERLAVLCNGAQVRKLGSGECLLRRDVPSDALHMLLKMARRYDLPVEFSIDSTLYLTEHSLRTQQSDPGLAFHRDSILQHHGQITRSLEPLCSGTVEKVNLMCIPETLREEVLQDLKNIPVCAVWASSRTMEITHRDASKGSGVQALCRLLEILPENVMALGDSGNDITMLTQAGLGIAMGNAPDFVKAAADAVTESNVNDGAAIAIERYALKK